MPILIQDWGHGLPDPGAVGNGKLEYKEAAKIAKAVEAKLPSSIKVINTRTSDKALNPSKGADLNARCAIANKNKADLFVSYHLNAGNGTGYETLVYTSNSQDKVLHAEIGKALTKHNVKDRGIKIRDNVRVLNGTNCKSILVECLFIDSVADMNKLDNATFFDDFTTAIANGICKALGVSPKTTTQAQASTPKPSVQAPVQAAPAKTSLAFDQWKIDAACEAIDNLAKKEYAKGLFVLNDPDRWKELLKKDPEQVQKELTWLTYVLIDRALKGGK